MAANVSLFRLVWLPRRQDCVSGHLTQVCESHLLQVWLPSLQLRD
jgi:hypothetical protein